MQVHTLNALNVILYHAKPSDLSSMKFLQDKQLLTHVLATLSAGDRSFMRAQPKALLTTALLLRLGPSWLTAAVGGHMLSHLAQPAASAPPIGAVGGNGTDAELEEYCSNCRNALAAAITSSTPTLLEAVCAHMLVRAPQAVWCAGPCATSLFAMQGRAGCSSLTGPMRHWQCVNRQESQSSTAPVCVSTLSVNSRCEHSTRQENRTAHTHVLQECHLQLCCWCLGCSS